MFLYQSFQHTVKFDHCNPLKDVVHDVRWQSRCDMELLELVEDWVTWNSKGDFINLCSRSYQLFQLLFMYMLCSCRKLFSCELHVKDWNYHALQYSSTAYSGDQGDLPKLYHPWFFIHITVIIRCMQCRLMTN